MATNDWIIEQKQKEGWRCDPHSGLVTRPDGTVHEKKSRPSSGYVQIELWGKQDGESVRKFLSWSRFICYLVHGKPPHPSYVADHIDHDILNNHPSNLRWVTRSENALNTSEAVKQERAERIRKMVRRRMDNPEGHYKLSYDAADAIRLKYQVENRSIISLAKEYAVSRRMISKLVHFRSWVRPENGAIDSCIQHTAA